MRNVRGSSLALLPIFVALLCYLSYFVARHETTVLLACYFGLFVLYSYIIVKEQSTNFWLVSAILLRVSLLFVLPNLSDDFYRFIWDGRLWTEGLHPFAALPSDFLQQNIPGLDATLFDKLNSKEHFTVYPPVAEFIFWISVKISPNSVIGSVIVMRIIIILSEVCSILIMMKMLERFQLPKKNVLLYALNPLVILELTGNLHFEALVIFFLLLSVWLLTAERVIPAAISFALAVGSKLLPLIFLPLMLRAIGFRNAALFYFVTGLSCLVLFIPMYGLEALSGFSNSLDLYFNKFEFNASLYYLVREYGFWKVGYNTIQHVGWKLGLVGTIFIVAYAFIFNAYHQGFWRKKVGNIDSSLFNGFLFTLLIYLFFATTVHPWYIIPLAAFSVFTKFRFTVFWTAWIFLTYIGYSQQDFSEKLWATAFEYAIVFGYLGYELIWRERELSQQ